MPRATSTASDRCQEKASAGQRFGESGEGSEIEGFSTDVGVQFQGEARRCDLLSRKIECERKRVGECLAAARERAAHVVCEALAIAHVDERRIEPVQDDDRRNDLWAREKLSG